jgi:hypothetical protein
MEIIFLSWAWEIPDQRSKIMRARTTVFENPFLSLRTILRQQKLFEFILPPGKGAYGNAAIRRLWS